jgi:hypothetical protein
MNNIPTHPKKSSPIPIREKSHTSNSRDSGASPSTSVSGSPSTPNSTPNSPLVQYLSPKKNTFYKPVYHHPHRYRHQSASPYKPPINCVGLSPSSISMESVTTASLGVPILYPYDNEQTSFRPYDAVQKAKGAGIIPYAIYNGQIHLLLQKINNPLKKKDGGWNDFGGKKNNKLESTSEVGAREFSEETSCLFYLEEQGDLDSATLYSKLKDNPTLTYDDLTISELKETIKKSLIFFSERINTYVNPIHVSSKETYISYVVKVKYIPIEDIPRAEDIHIPYEERYIRTCKWFTLEEFMDLDENDLHKRLQITKVKNRIQNFCERGLLD